MRYLAVGQAHRHTIDNFREVCFPVITILYHKIQFFSKKWIISDDIIDILSKLTKDTEVITIDDIEKHSLKGGVTFQIKYEDKSVVGVYWNFPTNQVEIFGETYYIDEKELKELSELLYDYWEG